MGDKTSDNENSCEDESLIPFKSSTNFNSFKMKKFFKHIYEREEAKNGHMIMENEEIEKKPVINHPPLPSDVVNGHKTLIISLKKEIIDPEEENTILTTVPTNKIKTEPVEVKVINEEPKPTICRDFLKNKCTRPKCRFGHENNKEARINSVTFCKDYQNKVCKHKNCRFVHASIFEQERYYKTGVLPPEALSHIKQKDGTDTGASAKSDMSLKPAASNEVERPYVVAGLPLRKTPPPPPPDFLTQPPNAVVMGPQNINVVPPSRLNGIDAVSQFPNINPIPAIINSPENMTINATVKRPWSDSQELMISPRGQVAVPKWSACEQCPILEERYKQCTAKISSLSKGVEDHNAKIKSVEKMHDRLSKLLMAAITIMGQDSAEQSARTSMPMENPSSDKGSAEIRTALQVMINRLSAQEMYKNWNSGVRSG